MVSTGDLIDYVISYRTSSLLEKLADDIAVVRNEIELVFPEIHDTDDNIDEVSVALWNGIVESASALSPAIERNSRQIGKSFLSVANKGIVMDFIIFSLTGDHSFYAEEETAVNGGGVG